jgi:pyroglutamyl-peptidase
MSVTSTAEPFISFIVTGFGPFHGCETNPTEWIATNLVQFLKSHGNINQKYSVRTLVLETSAMAAKTELDKLYEECNSTTSKTITVLLHLGVNLGGTAYQLEPTAYNEATFRCADEQNHQAWNEKVVLNRDYASCLHSTLAVSDLVERVNATQATAGVKAIVSKDPGRFVCNYTYCYSLNKFQCCKDDDNESLYRCLFLHVPPLNVAGLDDQLNVVASLLETIYQQLTESSQFATAV